MNKCFDRRARACAEPRSGRIEGLGRQNSEVNYDDLNRERKFKNPRPHYLYKNRSTRDLYEQFRCHQCLALPLMVNHSHHLIYAV
jgi:hypothetical protein